MPITPTEKIWMNGELVPWESAQVHILTHSLHYGTGVFEGVRAYETELYRFLESRHPQIVNGIREKKQLDDQLKGALESAVKAFSTDFLASKSAAA